MSATEFKVGDLVAWKGYEARVVVAEPDNNGDIVVSIIEDSGNVYCTAWEWYLLQVARRGVLNIYNDPTSGMAAGRWQDSLEASRTTIAQGDIAPIGRVSLGRYDLEGGAAMSLWEPSYVDYYPDCDEGYNKVIEGEMGLLQVEHTAAGWHGLILSWETWDADEDRYDYEDDLIDATGGLTLIDECVLPTREEAQHWCEDHSTEVSV